MNEKRRQLIIAEMLKAEHNEDQVWKEWYEKLFAKFCKRHQYFSGDEIKAWMVEEGLPQPHHHNVWGAMVNSMHKQGYMNKHSIREPTKNHNHMNTVNRWHSNLF